MRRIYTFLTILLAAAIFATGCAGSFSDQPDQSEDKVAPGAVETEPESGSTIPSETPFEELPERDQRLTQSPPPGLERVEITPMVPVTGEVPPKIMAEIFADLVERAGGDQAAIQVIRAEEVVWNDGSLGCPKPGEFYIQMLINGYWVVLEVEGVVYDYRVSDKGSFMLCEGRGGLPVPPPGDPGSGPAPDQ